ncbi:matrilin-1-like [Babylonia areolata]|uniref:matrilin-1-like n=1 Tax=Babylonia areolata TaxID=304850 RepID=UPI003FD5FE32
MVLCFLIAVAGFGSVAVTAAPTTTNDETLKVISDCQGKESDIYFLLDSSSSLLPRDFDKVLNFTASLVDRLDIGPGATQVGLGVFSDDFMEQFNLTRYTNKSDLLSAIRAVPYSGGGTYTGKGLRGMRTEGFRKGVARENATKIGVVITDGRSRHRTNTIAEASQLRDKNVWLFAIGVGRSVDGEELSIFASDPNREFVRHVSTFSGLADMTNDMAFGICRLQPPHADNATCGTQQQADILFVYNAAAMNTASVAHVQNFTQDVIQAFSITSGNVRVGVISEGRQGGDISLSQYIRKEDFVKALMEQPRSQLSALLKKARQEGFEPSFGARPNSKKFAIVFVDDVPVTIDDVVEARMMSYNDVTVYVIEVGVTGQQSLLKQLPTSPTDFSEFKSYSHLRNKPEQLNFIKKLCRYM